MRGRRHHAVLAAAAIGMFSGVVGLYISCHLSVTSGAAIALVWVVVFLIISALGRALRTASGEERHGTANPTA